MSKSRIVNRMQGKTPPTSTNPRPVDNTAPSAPGAPVVSNITADSATLTFTASASSDVAGYAAYLDGGDKPAAYSEGNATSITLRGLLPGSHSAVVKAFDGEGNFSSVSSSVQIYINWKLTGSDSSLFGGRYVPEKEKIIIAPIGSNLKADIYGLSTLNAIDYTNHNLIIRPGVYNEQFVIAKDGVLVSFEEGCEFNGTVSLNGTDTLSTSWDVMQSNSWSLVDAGLNVWKKPCGYVPWLFLDKTWLEPMPTSVNTNSSATILSNIAVHEFTLRDEAAGGVGSHVYLRLDAGETPAMFDITAPRSTLLALGDGMIHAEGVRDLQFEGLVDIFGTYSSNSTGVLIEDCTGVRTLNKQVFHSIYSMVPLSIIGGDDVEISCKASYSFNSIRVGAAKSTAVAGSYAEGDFYSTGTISVVDWETNYCGWQPRYIGTKISWDTDSDGGIAVGYKGGWIKNFITKRGVCNNGGPLSFAMKAGWNGAASTAARGSAIYVGTSDPLEIQNVEIADITANDTARLTVFVGGTGVSIGDVSVENVTTNNNRGVPIANNSLNAVINIGESLATSVGGKRTARNVKINGGSHSLSAISIKRANANPTYIVDLSANTINGCAIEAGYTSFGNLRINDAVSTAAVKIDRNFCTGPVGGVYGRINATNYADLNVWKAAGWDTNGGVL